MFRRCLLAFASGGALAALWLSGGGTEPAQAAPCPAPTVINLAGNVSISGTSPCKEDPEGIKVYCNAGNIWFDYTVNGTFVGPVDTGIACAAASRLSVLGDDGGDALDLSAVSATAGFTAIGQPNVIDGGRDNDLIIGSAFADSALGGSGSDILMLRDGVADSADCGTEIDAAQADRQSVDSLTSCEVADYLPAPANPQAPAAAAKKKCKAKHGKKRRCKKHHKR